MPPMNDGYEASSQNALGTEVFGQVHGPVGLQCHQRVWPLHGQGRQRAGLSQIGNGGEF